MVGDVELLGKLAELKDMLDKINDRLDMIETAVEDIADDVTSLLSAETEVDEKDEAE